MNGWTDARVDTWVTEWMGGWEVDGWWMDGWKDRCVDEETYTCMHGLLDGWMDGWMMHGGWLDA